MTAAQGSGEPDPQVPQRVEVSVAALCVHADAVLLIERGNEPSKGRWTLPGGRVEPGETLVDAVARELHEETGLEARQVGEIVDVIERIGGGRHFVIIDYRVEVAGDAVPVAGDDAADARWVRRDELDDYPLTRGLQAWLASRWPSG